MAAVILPLLTLEKKTLQQDQNVDGDLDEAADPELNRRVPDDIVDCLQQIAGQPE